MKSPRRSHVPGEQSALPPDPPESRQSHLGIIVAARAMAAVGSIGGVALISRVMYRLPWQLDGLVAVAVASAWVIWIGLKDGNI